MAKLCAGIGEIHVSADPSDTLVALGLGSCVAILLFDRATRTYGLAHAMLPSGNDREEDGDESKPGRYVDRAVEVLLDRMARPKSQSPRLVAALAGGASMFQFTGPSTLDIGTTNVAKAQEVLASLSIRVVASDLGGTHGRTLEADIATGIVNVRSAGMTSELVRMDASLLTRKKAA